MQLLEYLEKMYSTNINYGSQEFLDVNLNCDTKCFIDPFKIARNTDQLSVVMQKKLVDFFAKFLFDLNAGNGDKYYDAFHEVKPTRLGYGSDSWDGKGIGSKVLDEIFDSFKTSQALKSVLVKDIEDSTLFISKVGSDRVSDMVSNIIIEELISFTHDMCNKYKILIQDTRHLEDAKLKYYNYNSNKIEVLYPKLPFDMENRPIIFVPVHIISCGIVTLRGAHDHYMMGIIPHLLSNKNLFKLLTHTDMKDNQTKKETDSLIRQNFADPVPGSVDFSSMYINNYDKDQESIRIYKEYKKNKYIK